MRNWISIFIIFTVSTTVNAQVSVGESAPDFTLSELGSGESVTLSDFNDKVVYIFFYGAGCPHCRINGPITETEIFQMFKENENFKAFGIDTWNNSTSQNISFQNVTGITYPLLLNGRNSLLDYYGNTTSYDRSVVIGSGGIVEYKGNAFVNSDYEDVNDVIQSQLDALTTSSENEITIPSSITLSQNYPNPFNPSTSISFELNEASNVRLTIFNTIGQPVTVLADAGFSVGSHSLNWDASGMPSGVYFYRLETVDQSFTKRMLLLK